MNRTDSEGTPELSAERLSTLRHDLRTPFNQIIGYAEIIGEDADDASRPDITDSSAALVTAAHSTLGLLTAALQADPAEVTPRALAALRDNLTAPLIQLDAAFNSLQTLATTLSEDTPGNLDRIAAALKSLRTLVAPTGRWHQFELPEAPAASHAFPIHVDHHENTPAAPGQDTILIVDDHADNRDLLRQRLAREGFRTLIAENGEDALALLDRQLVDLVLLDVIMPGIDGIEVLRRIKTSYRLREIPVIMISALDEIERVVHCIENGAEDYLSKPFNPVLLRARIGVTLERKHLREEERAMVAALARERENAHNLLLNILPESVARELQEGHSAPMAFDDCTICFTDFVGFTLSTENMPAEHLVAELNTFFTAFDRVMERYGLEKMKTIGDSYMFASGLPQPHPANPVNAVLAAMELAHITEELAQRENVPGWKIRIGLHTGPVIAGVVGIRKFAFDIWGDSVNFASRMESSGAPGAINVSEKTYARIKDFFLCEHRGKVATKDKREVDMYFIRGIQPALIPDGTSSAFAELYGREFNASLPSFPAFLLD